MIVYIVTEVYVSKCMRKIIGKDADQPQGSAYLWDWEGKNGFNCICNMLFFNIYLKLFGQILIVIKSVLCVHW